MTKPITDQEKIAWLLEIIGKCDVVLTDNGWFYDDCNRGWIPAPAWLVDTLRASGKLSDEDLAREAKGLEHGGTD